MFKESVIENKKKKALEKKQRLFALHLRNKFLGEWASNILGLDNDKKKQYISEVAGYSSSLKQHQNNFVIKKIEQDFIESNIQISFEEIRLKARNFQIEANIISGNKWKLNNWKQFK